MLLSTAATSDRKRSRRNDIFLLKETEVDQVHLRKKMRTTAPIRFAFSAKQVAQLKCISGGDDGTTHEEKVRVISSLVSKTSTRSPLRPTQLSLSPLSYVKDMIRRKSGSEPTIRSSFSVDGFRSRPTHEELVAYNDLVNGIRSRDVDALREMHESGKTMQCSNQFGESLIHMACRRGYDDVVRFLVREGDAKVRVRDDFGRTPMHDACWTTEPNHDLMDLLIREDPELLLISDVRGHTPFDYARKEHWASWIEFLMKRDELVSGMKIH